MKFLVVLDANSIIGRTFGDTSEGHDPSGNPVFACLSIEDQGTYLACTRDLSSKGKSHQSMLIPHAAVAYVLSYAQEPAPEAWPMGFVPRTPPAR